MRPFWLTPKWVVGHLLVVTVLLSFSQFGLWQWRRHGERADRNAVIEARLTQPPLPLAEALAAAEAEMAAGASSEAALRFRQVVAVGVFEPADEILRRPVSRDGAPGYHVVTPLLLAGADGARVWVERGWVPGSVSQVPVESAPPPGGEVAVVGWLRATSTPPSGPLATIAPRDPPSGRLTTAYYLDPARLQPQVAGPLLPAVLFFEGFADGATHPEAFPLPPERPDIDPGPHLGYAIQWYAFALITLIGYTALLRRTGREQESEAPSGAPS